MKISNSIILICSRGYSSSKTSNNNRILRANIRNKNDAIDNASNNSSHNRNTNDDRNSDSNHDREKSYPHLHHT